jgi:biotin transporter BioY
MTFLIWLAGTVLFASCLAAWMGYMDGKGKPISLSGGEIVLMFLLCFIWYISVPIFLAYHIVERITRPRKK